MPSENLRSSDEKLRSELEKTVAAEDALSSLVKESKADGVLDSDEVVSLWQATAAYLKLNPRHEKIARMHRQLEDRMRKASSICETFEGTFEGILELHPKGYGFLRDPRKNYAAEDSNPFVSSSAVEKHNLREGVMVKGEVGPGTRNQGPQLQEVELIDGYTPEEYEKVKHFDDLTAIHPFEQIKLEVGPKPVTMRVMDLLCPIGERATSIGCSTSANRQNHVIEGHRKLGQHQPSGNSSDRIAHR